jgi:hypothetical protein
MKLLGPIATHRHVIRHERDVPGSTCWTAALQTWLASKAMPQFPDIPDSNVTEALVEFLEENPDWRVDLQLGKKSDRRAEVVVQACRFHFASTFVAPKPSRETEAVVKAWDKQISRIAATSPLKNLDMYSTGRRVPSCFSVS